MIEIISSNETKIFDKSVDEIISENIYLFDDFDLDKKSLKQVLKEFYLKINDEIKSSDYIVNNYEEYFLNSIDPTLLLGENGFVDANPAAVKVLEFNSKLDLIGLQPWEISPEFQSDGLPSYDKAKSIIQKAFLNGYHFFDWIHKTKSGKEIPFEIMLSKIEKNGKVFYFNTWRDISYKINTEKELANATQKLNLHFANTPLAVIDFDLNFNIISWNHSAERIFGYSPSEVLYKNISILFSDDKIQKQIEHFQDLLVSENTNFIINKNLRKDGSFVYCDWYNASVINLNNEIIGINSLILDVTERIKVSKQLEERNYQFKLIAENTADSIAVFDLNLNYEYISPSVFKLLGYTPYELMSIGLFTILDENSKFIVKNIFDEEMRSFRMNGLDITKVITILTQQLHKNGYYIWIESNISYFQDDQNQRLFILAVSRNVDNEVKSKQELILAKNNSELNENKFKSITTQSSEGIILTDLNGNFTLVNPTFCRLSGYTEEELLKMSVFDIKSDEIITKEFYKKIIRNSDRVFERIFYKKNGEYIIVELNAKLFNFGSKSYVLGNIRDITERKKTENALKLSEEKYKRFSEALTDMIVVYNFESRVSYINSSAKSYFGFDEDEYIGTNIFSLIYPDDHKIVIEGYNLRREGNVNNRLIQIRLKNKNGIYNPFEINTAVIQLNNQINSFISICRDISERKKREEELLFAKEKAEESDKLKTAFLANMSHEIRTPMNGILGFANILKDYKLTETEQFEYLTIIEQSGERMLNIINNIIDISKIESNQMDIIYSNVNLNDIFNDIYNFFKPEADSKDILLRLLIDTSYSNFEFYTDKEKLFAILINLVKNALKYTEKGYISIGYFINPNEVEFFVEDTGIGIPSNRQKAIFERFVQADIYDKRAFQGAGLGLSISQAYIDMLKGKIELQSEEGKGSKFTFCLPFENSQLSIASNSLLNTTFNTNINDINKIKILIVDDDVYSQKLLLLDLKTITNNIKICSNANETINRCKSEFFDIILMDIKLPDMSGFELTKEIRLFEKNSIIIAQTGFDNIYNNQEYKTAGFNDYLSKPIRKEVLINKILNFLKK